MADFFTFMHSVNHKAESVAMDEKPVEKAEVECGLCMTEKDKKSGECKFDKGAAKPVRDALMGYLEGEEETEAKPDGETEEESEVMVGEDAAPGGKFDESKHPRESKGGEGGGRFKTSNKTIEEQDVVSAKESSKEDKEISPSDKWKAQNEVKYAAAIYSNKPSWDSYMNLTKTRLEKFYGGKPPTMEALKKIMPEDPNFHSFGYAKLKCPTEDLNGNTMEECKKIVREGNFEFALAQDKYRDLERKGVSPAVLDKAAEEQLRIRNKYWREWQHAYDDYKKSIGKENETWV